MRRHGWELPYHPLQVVAIAVFVALAFAFYVFLAPFVGSRLMQLISLSIYSPLMVSVFGLYIWCAASNPADPAIFLPKRNLGSCTSITSLSIGTSTRVAGGKNETSTGPSSFAQPSSAQTRSSKGCAVGDQVDEDSNKNFDSERLCLFCGYSICNSQKDDARSEDDKLYCSLCEAEIYKCSKHCRVCDKCIDGFDHHCRWLNNCIGRKNYRIFIALMISGVCLLVLEWAIGVWVIARCFLNRSQFQQEISSRLGSSFSLVAFLSVVVVGTLLAAFATLPLGQLCLFHALLIQKGISTYDYIIAMREREQLFGVEFPSPYASPESSVATALSGASSAGALHHASWCTPPRLFIDHEQTPINFDDVKHISLETLKRSNMDSQLRRKKLPAKINPWALARLNPEDAIRAAAEARKKSSVLRPVPFKEPIAVVIAETDSSSEPSSDEFARNTFVATSPSSLNGHSRPESVSAQPKRQHAGARPWRGETSKVPVMLGGNARGFIERERNPAELGAVLLPLQLEARNAFCGRGNGGMFQSGSSFISTSTESSKGSPEAPSRVNLFPNRGTSPMLVPHASLPFSRRSGPLYVQDGSTQVPCYSYNEDEEDDRLAVASKPCRIALFERSTSDGYEASAGESADDSDQR
ncbi:hypothetical protein L7F22_031316 [Adiantum nelumboides]|nr:hypothetical protein [Adiantum nelumboides]